MKRTVTRTSYAIELTVEQFQCLMDWDAGCDDDPDRAPLVVWVEQETEAESVDYDPHFGPHFFYTIPASIDAEAQHKAVEKIIQKILDSAN